MTNEVLIAGAYAYTTTVLGGMVFAFFYLISWCREIMAQLTIAASAAATAGILAQTTTESVDRKLARLLDRQDT